MWVEFLGVGILIDSNESIEKLFVIALEIKLKGKICGSVLIVEGIKKRKEVTRKRKGMVENFISQNV